MSPPGWYPDPWLPTRWRYFDGAAWTGWVHPPEVGSAPLPPMPRAQPTQPVPPMAQEPPTPHEPPAQLGGLNSSPAAWWWAGGTLGVLLIVFLGLAWLVNR
jgi:hypothetical protein